jgi:hypothetical protein
VSNSSNGADPNCKQYTDSSKKVCQVCIDSCYLNNGVCSQINVLCKTANKANGNCLSCYDGYTLGANGACVVTPATVSLNNDAYCIKVNGPVCTTCASGYFLNQTGICQQVNPLCKVSNQVTGTCLSCYDGYSLTSDSQCIIPVVAQIPYCQTLNAAGGCVSCISGYYVKNFACALASITCGTYDMTSGYCLSCIPGYFLQDGGCIQPSQGLDPACQHYTNGFCDTCAVGFYVSSFICTQIDSQCLVFNYVSSVCTSCVSGKTVQGANCV